MLEGLAICWYIDDVKDWTSILSSLEPPIVDRMLAFLCELHTLALHKGSHLASSDPQGSEDSIHSQIGLS